ncbi:MAG: OB-fold nucleic acid binding domain-containing protein [Candidatus Nanohaloarchaea archaeon]
MDSEQIIEKITDETDLDEDDVEELIEEKMEEFSGLVSEEGALHLVAKEAGINVAEDSDQQLEIKNIVPGMRKVNLKARVTNILDPNTFERDDGEEGKVQNVVLGDNTGTIRLTLWDEQTEIAEKVEEDDAIHVAGAYTVEDNRGNAELRLGDEAQVKMADEDEVPEVESSSPDTGTTDASIREIRTENTNYRVKGMLVDVYTSNPFYRVDPETGNTVRENDDGEYLTDEGKEVEDPASRLAVSGVLDDGTGNIRVVFFGEIARGLLDIDEEEETEGDIQAVEEGAEKAIGKELVVEGRSRYNDYFGRIELLANDVEELDTGEQIQELLNVMEA